MSSDKSIMESLFCCGKEKPKSSIIGSEVSLESINEYVNRTRRANRPKRLALPPSDANLRAPEAYCFTIQRKRIEQAGLGYANLQYKRAHPEEVPEESEEVPVVTDMSKYGTVPEEPVHQEHHQKEPESSSSLLDLFWAPVCQYFNSDYTKKRKNKTKEQIEKSVSGKHDLYSIFGIEENVFEATES